MRVLAFVSIGALALAGCAASSGPTAKLDGGCPAAYELQISPTSATADHSASAPGNQQKFMATSPNIFATGNGCVESALLELVHPQWTSSDPLNVSVSSANDDTNGTATCTGMTGEPVTLSATFTQNGITKTGSALLSCK
jgi:hypothetical protein